MLIKIYGSLAYFSGRKWIQRPQKHRKRRRAEVSRAKIEKVTPHAPFGGMGGHFFNFGPRNFCLMPFSMFSGSLNPFPATKIC